jgi:hypothetical protein
VAALPGCTIRDTYGALGASGSIVGLAGMIAATANTPALFVQQSGGGWIGHAHMAVRAQDVAGLWQLVLPSQSNCDPSSVTWTLTLPDGTAWTGPVTDAMVTASQTTPLTLHDLKTLYGWTAG